MTIRSIAIPVFLVALLSLSCKKKGSTGGTTPEPPPVTEAKIDFRTDPNPGSNVYTSLSANFDFKVILTSTMPAAGINIDITTRNSANNEVLGSPINYKSNVASNNFTIGPLASGVTYTVSVVVSSQKVSTPPNTASKSFSVKLK
ncbi:MAG: hypothetical protein ACK5AO_01205 [bacterium]|jgi:hypothetical protein